jgi:PII-like signaling protein
MGFGRHSLIHTTKILRLSEDLPMVVEVVDSREKIDKFLPVLDRLITDGLVTLEPVTVIHYRG